MAWVQLDHRFRCLAADIQGRIGGRRDLARSGTAGSFSAHQEHDAPPRSVAKRRGVHSAGTSVSAREHPARRCLARRLSPQIHGYRPHLNLGFIYEAQAKYPLAVTEYSTALALLRKTEPRDIKTESELHARRDNVHLVANDLQAARSDFEQAVAVNPSSAPAYSYLGSLYERANQGDRAVAMFNRALAINPWDVVSMHNLGLHYLNRQRLDEALAQFTRVLELAPEHAGAHNNLASIYGSRGQYDLMEVEAKKAVYYDPQGVSARYNSALLYLNTGRVDEAIAQYQAITRTAPRESSNAYNQLGIIHAQRNELGQAIESWQKALEVDPNNQNAVDNLQAAKAILR